MNDSGKNPGFGNGITGLILSAISNVAPWLGISGGAAAVKDTTDLGTAVSGVATGTIIGIVVGLVTSIVGLIMSIKGKTKSAAVGRKNGFSIAGMILSIIGLVISIILAIVYIFLKSL